MYIDALIQIKNAESSGKKSLKVPYTKMDLAVLELLKRSGFLKEVEVRGRSFRRCIEIIHNPDKPLRGLRFLSRPSLRRYSGYRAFRRVKGGHGISVISTPRGIKTSAEARKEKVGGQLLFEIW